MLWKEYLYIDPSVWWIQRDLGKFNASSAAPARADTPAAAQGAWVKQARCTLPLPMHATCPLSTSRPARVPWRACAPRGA